MENQKEGGSKRFDNFCIHIMSTEINKSTYKSNQKMFSKKVFKVNYQFSADITCKKLV